MATDRAKIIASPVRVYVRAHNVTASYALSGYTDLGWIKEGGVKLTGDAMSETLQDGSLAQTGVTMKMEAEGVETTAAQIAAIETLALASNVDIMLVKNTGIAGAAALYLNDYGLTVGANFGFSRKAANTVKLTAQRFANQATAAYSEVTAA